MTPMPVTIHCCRTYAHSGHEEHPTRQITQESLYPMYPISSQNRGELKGEASQAMENIIARNEPRASKEVTGDGLREPIHRSQHAIHTADNSTAVFRLYTKTTNNTTTKNNKKYIKKKKEKRTVTSSAITMMYHGCNNTRATACEALHPQERPQPFLHNTKLSSSDSRLHEKWSRLGSDLCISKVPLTGLGIPTRAGNLYQSKTVRESI